MPAQPLALDREAAEVITPIARVVLDRAQLILQSERERPGSVERMELEWARFTVEVNRQFLNDDHDMQLREDDRRDRIAADRAAAGWGRGDDE